MLRIRKGINQDTIQEWNRSLLLKELRKKGICSRAHLAKLSELKQATVTNIMKDFIDWELVAETESWITVHMFLSTEETSGCFGMSFITVSS